MCTWFGAYSGPGTRMLACGLVYPPLLAETTWFGVPNVCSAERECMEHGIECHEVHNSKSMQVRYMLREEHMGHVKLLSPKRESLIRGERG